MSRSGRTGIESASAASFKHHASHTLRVSDGTNRRHGDCSDHKHRDRFGRAYLGSPTGAVKVGAGGPRRRVNGSSSGARAADVLAAAIGVDVQRLGAAFDDLAVDHDFLDARAWLGSSNIVSSRMPSMIERRPRAPVLRAIALRATPRSASSVNSRRDVLHLEQALVLLDQRVLRLGQDLDQRVLVEVLERRDHRQAADEFRDQAELQQILRLDLAQDLAGAALVGGRARWRRSRSTCPAALRDDLLEAGEGAAADEQDVGGVDLQEFLLRMLAAALRRHGGDRAFHDLQQRLLHALARHVAGDRRVVGLAADLVDLVDVDDAALRALDVVVGGLQQLQDDVLDVLADIAGFGQRRGVGHRERHVDDARQRLGQQRLAAAGRADQQDVRLRQLDVVVLRRRASSRL